MKVETRKTTILDVITGFVDNQEEGVRGYQGLLDIRPPYQREFVYKEKQRNAVIDTIVSGMPLNAMYWIEREDGTFEILDGQQRTISFCGYVNGDFSVGHRFFHNLTKEEQDTFLNYELFIYFCKGSEKEKLEWFGRINTSGEKMLDQEILNSVYTGTWLSDAKHLFSKTNCVAYTAGKDLVKGVAIRQDLLATALDWITDKGKSQEYMAEHQLDTDATELWEYYRSVLNWVKSTFPVTRSKEMKSVGWGFLFNDFGTNHYDPDLMESEIKKLMQDDDVTKKSGIYTYVLTRNEKFLSIRAFSDKIKRQKYEQQGGHCTHCGEHHEIKGMEADHIIPWSQGGGTLLENCQMLCVKCNREKSDK